MRKFRAFLVVIFLITSFISCNQNNLNKTNANKINKDSLFKASLVEYKLGESNYYVSFPKAYQVSEKVGPDFNVYYFSSKDSVNIAEFSGGFYFGNHPNEFGFNNDSCKLQKLKKKFLDQEAKWKTYKFKDDSYFMQSIINNNLNEGWNNKIHTFGKAKDTTDLNKLFHVFSTFNKK